MENVLNIDYNNLEPVDEDSLEAINNSMDTEALPPVPSAMPEYQNLPPDNSRYQDEVIDYENLVPVDEDGYEVTDNVNPGDLVPYDGEITRKELGPWDEAMVKKDVGNITQYRAGLARQVMFGGMSVDEAKDLTQKRYGEILNKYGIEEIPEFSFAKFRANPFKTMFGEAAQMLPFYWEGTKKGAAVSLATIPIAVGKNAAIGAAAGSVVPVAGTAAGASGGVVAGIVEGVSNGMLVGTFIESMEVEGGNLYLDLREKGIEHNTAMAASLAGGVVNGLLETVSFGVMTAPIKGVAKKAAAKLVWDGVKKSPAAQKLLKGVITKCTKEYFKRMGTEVTTEMLQDVVSNTMTLLAAQAESVEDAKPTGEDWRNIITKTGAQTAAAMAVMGLVSTPFDVMNANVGSVKNSSNEVATKAEVEQNLKEMSEGTALSGGDLVLQGGVAYDTVAEGQNTISELEAELDLSNRHLNAMQKEQNTLSKKKNLSPEEKNRIADLSNEIQYEKDYQNLVKEEIVKTSSQMSENENQKVMREKRKAELQQKVKNKEKLTLEEKQELADISVAEFEEKEKSEISEDTSKARSKQITKEIRDLDDDIEQVQNKEDEARKKRNKIEEKQDKLQGKIDALEKENEEIKEALKSTEIDNKAEMQTTLNRNKKTIEAIKNNIKDLESQRLALNEEVENAIRESDTLSQKRAELDKERANISEGVLDENGKIDMTAGQYKNQRLSALNRTMKAIANALKTGARLTRREIRDVQNTAISLIKNSDMLNSDKAKFLTTLRDINSQEKLKKILPDLIDKISDLEEKANKKSILSYIGKLLKQAKPKKGGSTPVGKFTADIQKVLDNIKEAVNLSTDEAYSRIEEIFDKAGDRDLTDDETSRIRALYNFSGIKSKTSKELLPLARMLKMLITDGKIAAELKAQNSRQHREQVITDAKKSIEGSKGEITIDRKKPGFKKVLSQFLMTLGHTFDGWDGLMHTLSLHDRSHVLQKMLDVFPAKMQKIAGVIEYTKKVNQAYKDIFNIKDDKQFLKKCNEDSVIEDVGKYVNQDGETVTLQMSRAEARKLYMEMQDPTLADSLREGNKYTFNADVNTKVDKSTEQLIAEYLTPEDKDFAKWQLQFYQDYGKRTNVFYREKFGMDMPANEFYSPIKRLTKEIQEGYDWKNEVMYRLSMKPSSFKARTNVKNALAPQNDMLCLADHISQNEHYMAMDGVVTDMDTIFKNNDIRDMIINKYGDGILKVVDAFINDIKRDGIEAARAELKGLNKFRVYLQGGLLGLKAQIALKQMTAIGVFATDIPAVDFATGLADFFKNPLRATEILSKSDFLKDRQDALSLEMRDLVRSNEYHMFAKMSGLRKQMFWFTQFGDKWSIIMGGWTVYRSVLNKTGSEKAAMEAFERTADKYQQSGHIDQLSAWQRSNNVFQKALVMFTSDQMKQARAEIHAIRDAIVSGKKEDILYAAKTIAIMHIILPNLVQVVTNGMSWDNDDQLRATLLGPFSVYPIVGDILNTAISEAMRFAGRNVDNFGAFDNAFFKPLQSIDKAFKKIKPEEITPEDIWKCLAILGKEVSPVSGINLKPVIDVVDKAPKYYEKGEYGGLTKLMMGWSPYVIEKKSGGGKSADDEDYEEDKE